MSVKGSPVSYRGSNKHKKRPDRGRKGTLCPEWTHSTSAGGYETDPYAHNWMNTHAHKMFMDAEEDPGGSGKRYATARGIAFVAQPTADGSWHGYPLPWMSVPPGLLNKWRSEKKMTASDLRRYNNPPAREIGWALDSSDE